jgi:hypothetical protein
MAWFGGRKVWACEGGLTAVLQRSYDCCALLWPAQGEAWLLTYALGHARKQDAILER